MIRLEGDYLRKAWPQLRPMIQRARERAQCEDPFLVEDVYHRCMTSDTQCFVTGQGDRIDGVVFLRPVNNWGRLELHCWIACFNAPAKLSDHMEWMEGLAKHCGAERLTCNSLRAFEAIWPGGREESRRLVKEVV